MNAKDLFEVGDVVQLKVDSPKMIISSVTKNVVKHIVEYGKDANYYDMGDIATCEWFDNEVVHQKKNFDTKILIKVKE